MREKFILEVLDNLKEKETDLAYATRQGIRAKDTLDFCRNPRFQGNTIEVNQRYDRIFLKNTYPKEFPQLLESNIFGTKVYGKLAWLQVTIMVCMRS